MSYTNLIVASLSGVPLAELSVEVEFISWRLNNVGQCKFKIARLDPKATQVNLNYGNRVLIEFENGLPNWVGVLDPPREWDKDQITVNAYSLEKIFEKRYTDKGRYFSADPVGTIFQTLIQEANDVSDTGIDIGSIWTGGSSHSPEYHLKSLLEIFQKSLTTRLSTSDFDITGALVSGVLSFQANFYESKGSDKSQFALIQDKNLSKIKLKEQGPITNSWTAAGEGTDWGADRLISTGQDANSISAYGLREDAKVYSDVSDQNTLDGNVANLLEVSKNPYNIFTLSVLDELPAQFADYDVGDVVSLLAQDYGFGGTETTIRILSREFKPANGICDLVVQEVLGE